MAAGYQGTAMGPPRSLIICSRLPGNSVCCEYDFSKGGGVRHDLCYRANCRVRPGKKGLVAARNQVAAAMTWSMTKSVALFEVDILPLMTHHLCLETDADRVHSRGTLGSAVLLTLISPFNGMSAELRQRSAGRLDKSLPQVSFWRLCTDAIDQDPATQ